MDYDYQKLSRRRKNRSVIVNNDEGKSDGTCEWWYDKDETCFIVARFNNMHTQVGKCMYVERRERLADCIRFMTCSSLNELVK